MKEPVAVCVEYDDEKEEFRQYTTEDVMQLRPWLPVQEEKT